MYTSSFPSSCLIGVGVVSLIWILMYYLKMPTFLVLTPPCPLGGYYTLNWSCNALEFVAMYTSFLPVEEQIANDGRYVLY